jgi:hypothetical protein
VRDPVSARGCLQGQKRAIPIRFGGYDPVRRGFSLVVKILS